MEWRWREYLQEWRTHQGTQRGFRHIWTDKYLISQWYFVTDPTSRITLELSQTQTPVRTRPMMVRPRLARTGMLKSGAGPPDAGLWSSSCWITISDCNQVIWNLYLIPVCFLNLKVEDAWLTSFCEASCFSRICLATIAAPPISSADNDQHELRNKMCCVVNQRSIYC